MAPDGTTWLIGTAAWLIQQNVSGIDTDRPHTGIDTGSAPSAVVHISRNGQWAGRIELQDRIRDTSLDALEALRQDNCTTLLVTGDHAAAAQWVGKKLKFAPQQIHAAQTPDDKVRILQSHGENTAFVGDGINDTLVLAAAGCGVAINGANPIAVTPSG